MQIRAAIRKEVQGISRGELFTNERFLHLGPAAAVNRALSRLVAEGLIVRPFRGIYVRPKQSRLVGDVLPETLDVVKAIADRGGETIQMHGATAANRFQLSTQVPLIYVFHTDGPSRQVRIYNMEVKFVHTDDSRLLQFSGTRPGLAISALWYMGPDYVTPKMVSEIRERMLPEEFETLKSADLPDWMSRVVNAPASRV